MEQEDPEFPVDPENWDAVETFCRCTTQWVYGPMGGAMGMSYPGVESVLRMTQPKARHKELFAALQVMERSAMAIMNKSK